MTGDEDDEALDAIPAAFAIKVEPRARTELARHTFESLKGEKVIVRANGFIYRGLLVGADEGELYLRGEMRWVVLPLAHITGVVKDDAKDMPLGGPEKWEPADEPTPAKAPPPTSSPKDEDE